MKYTEKPIMRRTILRLLLEGYSQPEIAHKMVISLSTLEKQLKYLKEKHYAKTIPHLIWKLSKIEIENLKYFE